MTFFRFRIFFSTIAIFFLWNAQLFAQTWDSFEFVRADWHLAGISEAGTNWQSAAQYYQKVIEESRPLPLEIREWYRGTAYYGLARCGCRSGATQDAIRLHLSRAFSHEFWNFNLISNDTEMLRCCGMAWFDSNKMYWSGVHNEERSLWRDQEPIFFFPSAGDSNAKLPVIFALHGGNGNYESFAEQWRAIANDLHAIIVVPPGIIRESQITNSWGSDMDAIYKPLSELVGKIAENHHADMSHIYLAGFSQGAQASIELTLLHPDIFRGAIAMSGFVDRAISDSAFENARSHGVRIFAISGVYEYPLFQAELDTVHTRATQHGIPFQLRTVEGMIHEVPLDFHSQMLDAWNWVRQPEMQRVQASRVKGK